MSKTIDEILSEIWLNANTTENTVKAIQLKRRDISKAKQAITEIMEYVIGERLPTFGPQNESGDISLDDYEATAVNHNIEEQRTRLKEVLGENES